MGVQAGWPRGWAAWVAGVGTAGLLVLTAMDLGQHYQLPLGTALALGVARALGLALAWVRPGSSVPVSLLTTILTAAVSVPVSTDEPWPWPVTGVFGQSAVLAVVGARGASRLQLVGWWVVTQLVGVVALLLAPERGSWLGLLTIAVFSAVAVVLGDVIRSSAATRDQLTQQETISAAERAGRSRLQERARIARELHDVVAHHLSVVVVRADSAPHRLGELPESVREEFAGIAEEARTSLTEMRRVLRLLREDPDGSERARPGGEDGQLEPQPGLAELDELVERARRAGADIRLESEPVVGTDPAIELTVYRVVQEAISNAVRHAPGTTVHVSVLRVANDLLVKVVNAPPRTGGGSASTGGGGQGLVGMGERVGLVDGTFWAGGTSEGGYLVDVAIPLREVGQR